jgi:hypothetical protein
MRLEILEMHVKFKSDTLKELRNLDIEGRMLFR